MRPRKYFWATMFVAVCDQNFGNSTIETAPAVTPSVAARPLPKPDSDACEPRAGHSLGRVIRRKLRLWRRSPPPTRMRLRSMTGWLPPLVAVVLALAVGGSARADVCVGVNPGLDIGCRDGQGAPPGGGPTATSAAAGAPPQ